MIGVGRDSLHTHEQLRIRLLASADHADLVQLPAVVALHMRHQLYGIPEGLRAVRAALRLPCKHPIAACLRLNVKASRTITRKHMGNCTACRVAGEWAASPSTAVGT